MSRPANLSSGERRSAKGKGVTICGDGRSKEAGGPMRGREAEERAAVSEVRRLGLALED